MVKDSNGTELNDGDSVQVIKDLKVKGTSTTLKRGTVYKNIRLTSNDDQVECRQGKTTIVLKTCFLKKV
jgi:protein PhnA